MRKHRVKNKRASAPPDAQTKLQRDTMQEQLLLPFSHETLDFANVDNLKTAPIGEFYVEPKLSGELQITVEMYKSAKRHVDFHHLMRDAFGVVANECRLWRQRVKPVSA
jgi:hypothetical protein